MRAIPLRFSIFAARIFTLAMFALISVSIAFAQSQATAADLTGQTVDPNGAVIAGATVTAKNSATGISRTTTSNSNGEYQFIALPPGNYEVTAEAKTFKKVKISPVTLTVGQSAELQIKLEVGLESAEVTITGDDVDLVETTKTSVSNTIGRQSIENLPINERSATGFALTLSTVGRDNGRPIGPAPTSGLNIGGQRGRSTQVNVDGADFTDNSVNAARTTVSQEAVQEYQVATNSYLPEFGRATGGVVNVVTKSGGNDFRGSAYGYLRDKSIQARNAFSPIAKPDYKRYQYGFSLGGPIIKEKTFFFVNYERRQRDESGFFTSDVAQGLNSSVTLGAPILPFTQTFNRLTAQQAAYANTLIATGSPAAINAAVQYLFLASSGGNTALLGTNPLISAGGAIPAGTVVGQRFFLSGAPVPVGTVNAAGEPIAFRPLLNLQKVFPITDRSNFFTTRVDHNINANNQFTFRFGYNPGTVTGIQVESQNQSLGQNDFSRTGIQTLKDLSVSTGLTTTVGNWVLENKFNFGRRATTFKSTNGDATAFNISGTAFIGRELFSPVDRVEKRFQFASNFNYIWGAHAIKFGSDFNLVDISKAAFELNFAGLFNFGEFAATNLAAFPTIGTAAPPAFTPVQSYGLGLPSIFIQGFGNPNSLIKNKPMAFYGQDSWKITKNFTLNYGLRYDIELTDQIAPVAFRDPLSGINLSSADILAAQDAMGVQQGFPRDKNNFAPRLAAAWDVFGNSKTVIRGAFGLFYDHPLLAVAFNSDIADAAQQQQAVLTPGSPAQTALLNATQVFQGTVCVPGAPATAICPVGVSTPGVAASALYQFGRQRFDDQRFPGFGAVLPFTLPVSKDFEYAYATQGNFAVEHQINKDMAISASYIFVGAKHLPHPTDLNAPRTDLQIQNFSRFFGGALPASTTQAIAFSIATTAAGTPTGVGCFVVIPGIVATCPTGRVVAPAVANFFRPSGPNYFLASALTGGAVSKAVLDSQIAGSLRTPGVISPFGSVNAQVSDGNSTYNAMNIEFKRRMSSNFQFLATYTWAHSIDDSSDLQTLLLAQDVRNFRAERADSLFDQRHRFVFSGVMTSPAAWRSGNTFQKIFSDFMVAPIIEFSSGRPFNIITNVDTNNDQSSQTDRPNVDANGLLILPGAFQTGGLGRNFGITHSFASFDLGVTRSIKFGERFKLDLVGQVFNLFNKFNEGSASPLYTDVNAFGQRAGNGRYFSRPTAAYDPRQFQLGLKFTF